MDNALEKSISFLLFIVIGILLKTKISKAEQTNGIKSIILTIALPATIFIALLKIQVSSSLLWLPVIALFFNSILFSITPLLLKIIGVSPTSPSGRSAQLLIPSLAPGLSCFPFILEFLGNDSLAKAAMADLGNKFFVLFLLYLIALKWHYKNAIDFGKTSIKSKLKSLCKALLYEPVNMFIFVALVLIFSGITFDKIPNFIASTIDRLSLMMTPLVLLFIGLAVQLKKKQFFQIFSLLLLRASFTLLVVAGIVLLLNVSDTNDILVMLVFGLSSCSFWPFAHISSISAKEMNQHEEKMTFDVNFALSIIGLSLPISVLLILGIFSAGDTFTEMNSILGLSGVLFLVGIMYPIFLKIKSTTNDETTSEKIIESKKEVRFTE